MENQPQTATASSLVSLRSTESPRTRRYGSNEPVVTASELYNNVSNGTISTDTDPESQPQPQPRAQDAEDAEDAKDAAGEAPAQCPCPPTRPTPMRRARRCVVRRACCCLTLQQGAYCIGVMQVANGLLMLLLELMYLAGVLSVGAYALDDDLTGNLPGSEQRWGSIDIAYASLSGILLLQELIVLFFAGLLLHGARTGRRGFLKGWLLFTAIMLAIGVGAWAARLTLEFMYKPWHGGVLFVRALIELTPTTYFLIVVRSYYYELLDDPKWPPGVVAAPLLGRDPPPYSDQAPGLPPKQPLETSFDGPAPTTIVPAPAAAVNERYDLSYHEDDETDNDEGGFGPSFSWIRSRSPQPSEEAGPLPRKTPLTSSYSGPLVHIEEGGMPRIADEDHDYDEVEPQLRPRMTRPLIGAGPMVLPPLPPGHRASLQQVPLDQQPPVVRFGYSAQPSAPPGAPPTAL